MGSIEEVLEFLDRQWHHALGTVQEVEWEQLPAKAKDELYIVFDRVTQHRTLLPEFLLPDAPPETVAAAVAAPSTRSLVLRHPREAIRRHPYIFGALLTGALGLYCAWRPPAFFGRLPVLCRLVTPSPIAPPVVRPRKLADGTRLDVVLVLGAERGSLGREIAVDLERRGFVVLASVPAAAEVDALERLGRGHIKALVLDPSDAGTIAPFLRSLSTSLSLRFPIDSDLAERANRPVHQSPSLCAVVNALALATHCSTARSADAPGPLEATPLSALSDLVQQRVITTLGVLQGTLPLLRAGPHASSVVTLVPASTARLALPYVGPQSVVDGALANLTDVLRRELGGSKVSVATLDVGFFERPHHGSARHHVGLGQRALELPPHLRAVYQPRAAGAASSRTRSDVRKLTTKVARVVLGSGRGRHAVGAGASTYGLASLLPARLVDGLLGLQQRLSPSPPAVVEPSTGNERAARRPLPTPPSSGHSSGMESSYIQVKPSGATDSESDESGGARAGELVL